MYSEKLAIVVPYRNRENHLKQFVPHMEEFLSRSITTFKMFFIEQADDKPFNRGKLINIGCKFAIDEGFEYMALHDIDMLPVEANYSYVKTPTHMATRVEQFWYQLPYKDYFGGVTMFDKESFIKVNGFDNDYWGWGGEDDDIFYRCAFEQLFIDRREGTYKSLPHHNNREHHPNYKANEKRASDMRLGTLDHKNNGLNSLTFEVLKETSLNGRDVMISVTI